MFHLQKNNICSFQLKVGIGVGKTTPVSVIRKSYFDDCCHFLPHHRALLRKPPHLQTGATGSHKKKSTEGKPRSFTRCFHKKCKNTTSLAAASHHKVSATAEHFSRNSTVRAAGVFRIQHVTVKEQVEEEEERRRFISKTLHVKTCRVHWTFLTSSPPSYPELAVPPAGCTAVLRLSPCPRRAAPLGWRKASL